MSTMEFKCLYAITLGPDSILVNLRGLKKQSTCRTRLQPTRGSRKALHSHRQAEYDPPVSKRRSPHV